MAIAKTHSTLGTVDQNSTTDATTATGQMDGKAARSNQRARCFFNIIGGDPSKPKRVRGRIGGEMPRDDRWLERRGRARDRVVARLRADAAYASEQIGLYFEGGSESVLA